MCDVRGELIIVQSLRWGALKGRVKGWFGDSTSVKSVNEGEGFLRGEIAMGVLGVMVILGV